MRVQFQMSGGVGFFPGLAAPKTIDVDSMPEADRTALRALVDAASFFSLPSRVPAAPGAADYRTYEITIEDGGRRHTVAVSDPVESPALRELIDKLRSYARG